MTASLHKKVENLTKRVNENAKSFKDLAALTVAIDEYLKEAEISFKILDGKVKFLCEKIKPLLK